MTTPAYDHALALCDKLKAAGITATVDPRSATPPCVLIGPPRRKVRDLGCGFTGEFELIILVPGTGNADAFRQLDALDEAVAAVLPVTESNLTAYVLSADAPPLPAYRVELTEGVAT